MKSSSAFSPLHRVCSPGRRHTRLEDAKPLLQQILAPEGVDEGAASGQKGSSGAARVAERHMAAFLEFLGARAALPAPALITERFLSRN